MSRWSYSSLSPKPGGDPWAEDRETWSDADWESGLGDLPDDEPAEEPPPVVSTSRPRAVGNVLNRRRRDRFWVLQRAVAAAYGICWAIVGIALLVGGWLFYESMQTGGGLLVSSGLLLLCLLIAVVIIMPYLAYVQLLDCFLAIEENTRRAAER